MKNKEPNIHDELIRRVVDLDNTRQTLSLDVQDEDIVDALADVTDISREEIDALAKDIRACHETQASLGTRISTSLRAFNLKGIGVLCVIILLGLGVVYRVYPPTAGTRPLAQELPPAPHHPRAQKQTPPAFNAFREKFEQCCPRPTWWDRVSIADVEIRTYDELLSYWQNKQRSKNQFFKAAYQAILDYPQDTALVVTAIKLMPYGDSSYPHVMPLLEFAVERYFDFDHPLANYGGMPGDTIAGIVEKLARLYTRSNRPQQALALIERLLTTREDAINDHLLELIALEHATALFRHGRRAEAISVLQTAIVKYHGSWEARLKKQLARYEQ